MWSSRSTLASDGPVRHDGMRAYGNNYYFIAPSHASPSEIAEISIIWRRYAVRTSRRRRRRLSSRPVARVAMRTRAVVYYLIYPRYVSPVLSRCTYYIIIHNVVCFLRCYSRYPSHALIIYSCFMSINRPVAPSRRPARSRRPFNPRVEPLQQSTYSRSSLRVFSFSETRALRKNLTFENCAVSTANRKTFCTLALNDSSSITTPPVIT